MCLLWLYNILLLLKLLLFFRDFFQCFAAEKSGSFCLLNHGKSNNMQGLGQIFWGAKPL